MSSPPRSTPKVLFATPECAPLVKTGGLGDVSAALPEALVADGLDVRVLLPGYKPVLAGVPDAAEVGRTTVLGHEVRILEAKLPNGVPLWVADCPVLYARSGGPYQDERGDDWEDNAVRFGVLSRLAADLGSASSPLSWQPDVVHCNDWPTALAPVYLRFAEGRRAASLVTIHNLAFQGAYEFSEVTRLGLPPAALSLDGVEFYGRASFLKGGLVYADAINTVSPTYAREIQGEELGFGMHGVLRYRADRLYGVLNGIDTRAWDPATDSYIARRYGPDSLEGKAANKAALRLRMGLEGVSEKPLAAMVTRLTHQKGIDFVTDAADALVALGVQVAVVGTGDRDLVARLEAAQSRHRGQFAVFIGFDESLAHLVEAGADMFLMPSRFEPCGMNQMYSQRYGTPPIANPTGGLVDTIEDGETGFMMSEPTSAALIAAVRSATYAWRDAPTWRRLQLNGMRKDFGWREAAKRYAGIYKQMGSG